MKERMEHEPREIVTFMALAHGRDLSIYDESYLAQALEKRRLAAGCKSVAEYRGLLSGCEEAEVFYHSLNIAYSEFFRSPLVFALLEQQILPGLVLKKDTAGKRSEIRIWSAACAAGQEAYSCAMLIEELSATRDSAAPYRIFASDLSEAELETARRGVYHEAAVQNVRLKQIHNFFTRQGDHYTVRAALREHIEFSCYDLLDRESVCPPASIFGDFDIIFCSNLLFYYRDEIQRVILDKMRQSLAPGGYLVTGEAERMMVNNHGGFHSILPPVAIFQATQPRR